MNNVSLYRIGFAKTHMNIFLQCFVMTCSLWGYTLYSMGMNMQGAVSVRDAKRLNLNREELNDFVSPQHLFDNTSRVMREGYNENPLDVYWMKHLRENASREIKEIIAGLQIERIKKCWPFLTILEGEHGVGKTIYAKFIAQALKRPYVLIAPHLLEDENLGSGKRNISYVIKKASEQAIRTPLVLIIDPLEEVLHRREMNAFFWITLRKYKDNKNLLVIATITKFYKLADTIESGITGGLHMGWMLSIENPQDSAAIKKMLLFLLNKHPHNISDDYLNELTWDTRGLTYRVLDYIVKEAHRNAKGSDLSFDDLSKALEQYRHTERSIQYRKALIKYTTPTLIVGTGLGLTYSAASYIYRACANLVCGYIKSS